MRRFFTSFLIFFASATCLAQWKIDAGINIFPIRSKTFEITSEFSHHPGYGLILNLGQTIKTGYTGLLSDDLDDGIRERTTSGAFFKAGARLYPTSFAGKDHKASLFVGGFVILSQYRQTGLKNEFINNGPSDVYTGVSSKGTILFPAAVIGLKHQLSRDLILEWGFQKSFIFGRNDYLGRRSHNYQPGAGSAQSDPFFGYCQGILSLKYRFRNRK
jgi:hypothetical protein